MVVEMSHLVVLKMVAIHHFGFLNFQTFSSQLGLEGQYASLYQISAKLFTQFSRYRT